VRQPTSGVTSAQPTQVITLRRLAAFPAVVLIDPFARARHQDVPPAGTESQMKLVALASLVSLATSFAAFSTGCAEDDPPGVFVDFRIEAESFRPDQIDFHWMHAGQADPTRHRLPRGGGSVSQGEFLLYRVFVEIPGALTERRLLTAVGIKGTTVVSGGVLVLHPSYDSIRYETLVLKAPLPDDDNDQIPNAVESNCLAVDINTCYPPGEAPPPLPDAGAPDEAPPPIDASDDAETGDVPAETAPPIDTPPEAPPNPLLVDLVGHWRLDDATGDMVRDWSGRNNTGTLRGVNPNSLWIPVGMGRWGGALNLPDATGNGVTVPASSSIDSLQRAFTISAQTWRTAHRAAFATIVSRRYMNGQNEYFNLHFRDGIARGIVNSHQPAGVAQGEVIAPAQAPLGNWVHVALTYDGTTLRLYQNGMQVNTAAYAAPVMGTATPLCLGCGQNGSSNSAAEEALGGRLDDVLIWSRPLSADEIRRVSMGEHLM
jgi:hypothetical protein